MKEENRKMRVWARGGAVLGGLATLALAVACGGDVGGPGTGTDPVNPNGMDPGTGMTGGGAGPGGGGGGGVVVPPAELPAGVIVATGLGDSGSKCMHQLNNAEYNNTVADMLGSQVNASTFAIGESNGFDNVGDVQVMNGLQYTRYFQAATTVADDVFANPALLGGVVTCATEDAACVDSIVNGLGLRLWRRPLLPAEVTTMSGVYNTVKALGVDHNTAVKQVLRAFLASSEFLYRMEFDANPADTAPHLLSDYELASRLSYFYASTAPDATLLQAAAAGGLNTPESISAHIDRMMADTKYTQRFVTRFAGQWLGVDKIPAHTVNAEVFPEYSDALGQSMMNEAYAFFAEFTTSNDLPWTQFLSKDMNFVDTSLAAHYGMDTPANGFARVENTTDARKGFLGLAAFLTLSSYEHRTSPTLRARWILSSLLCSPPPDPPMGVVIPELGEDGADLATGNIRDILEAHRANPSCAACHAIFDPFGIALENFDAVGRYRDAYPNGEPIDPSGEIQGQQFAGLDGMIEVVNQRPGLTQCVSEKLFVYSLGRGVVDSDKVYLDAMRASWATAPTLKNLIKTLVVADTFRMRRGGWN